MENKSVYGDLKDFYSTKVEYLLENYKTIGSDYTILGFDKEKAFILSHKNSAMYLVEGTSKVNRLDLNTEEYDYRFKTAVDSFVSAVVEGKPSLASLRKKELYEALNEQLYLFALPCDGVVPISEAVRKRVFDCLMENQLFKEYLTKLGGKIKNNQTVLIEAIPYLGLRARDKLIKFFREQIEMTYDQARMAAVALLNLAFGKQYNESLNAKNLYRSINSVLPPSKSRELTYFILETAGRALLNEFKVQPNLSGSKVTPIKAIKGDKLIVEPTDEGKILDHQGNVLKSGTYDVIEATDKGAIVSGGGKKYEGVLMREAKTYFKEAVSQDELPIDEEDGKTEIIPDESPTMTNEEELQNALSILKSVFKDEVSELSLSADETFEENEKGFKKLMSSITNLEKYLEDLHAEAEITETDEATEETEEEEFPDIEQPEKKKAPDVDINDILDEEEPDAGKEEPKDNKQQNIEDILNDIPVTSDENEAPPIEEAIGEPGDNADKAPAYPSMEDEEVGVPAEAPAYPEEGEDAFAVDDVPAEAPAYDDSFAEEPKTITLGDAFIFESDDDIKDIKGVKLAPEEVYTVVSIDEDNNECALANEKGVKSVVSVDSLKEYNNYFSPVKSLSEGTILEVVDENILDDDGQVIPIGEYELVSLDQEANIAKISDMSTNRLHTLDLNNLGSMGVVKTPETDAAEPASEEGIESTEDVDELAEPEKTEYPEEAYDEVASSIAQVVDDTPAPEANVESDDDKVEITIKIPSDQIEGTKVEDLLFGLTNKTNPGVDNPDENYNKLYGNSSPHGEDLDEVMTSRIPPQVLQGEDKEVLDLYKQLLSVEDEINAYVEKNKDVYQLKQEADKYIALLDKLKEQLTSKPSDGVKKDVKDFIETLKDESDELVDEENPAPAPSIDLEDKEPNV
jgi:uncharacterized protein (UPF0179 family)